MIIKRVLVCSTNQILCAGVANLLTNETDLEVIRIATEEPTEVLSAITRHDPDAVIFHDSLLTGDGGALMHLITNYVQHTASAIRIITVSADDNWVHAYLKKDILLSKASDLAEVIRSR